MPGARRWEPSTREWTARIEAMKPDLILSVYYRHMIGQAILDRPRLGAFNMHGSLLPKYCGRAPINWAVLLGENRSDIPTHRLTMAEIDGRSGKVATRGKNRSALENDEFPADEIDH